VWLLSRSGWSYVRRVVILAVALAVTVRLVIGLLILITAKSGD
jgi:hypothetical protein